MRKLIVGLALLPTVASAQSSPNFTTGQVPTANQWNSYFAGKVDVSGGNASGTTVLSTGSTTSRTLAARFAEVYNVNDEGVVCNGTTNGVGTDNATALANLMTKAGAAAASGRSVAVYFPPQTAYCLTSNRFLVPSNVTLWAYPGTVVIAPTLTANPAVTLLLSTATSASNVYVYGLTFDGGLNYSPVIGSSTRAILIGTGVSNFTFDNITVRNTRGRGLELQTSVENFDVRNSTFTNIGNYWKTSGSSSDRMAAINANCSGLHKNLRVKNSRFDNIGLDPIAYCNTQGGEMAGNTITNTDQQYITVSTADYPGVYVLNSSGIRIENNTVNGEPGNCLDVAGSSNLVVAGNRFLNCGAAGAALAGANITATGNQIQNVWASAPYRNIVQRGGFTLFGAAGNMTFAGNQITDQHTQLGIVTNGSKVITGLADTSFMTAGLTVTGSGIPAGATIASVDSLSQITLSANATVDGKPTALTFGTVTVSTSISSGNTAATVSSATGLSRGMAISGTGIEVGTTISAISGTSVTLSRPATATDAAASLTYSAATTQYCFEGIGTPAATATGVLANVYIDASNQCIGPAVAPFTVNNAMTGRITLTTGQNY